LFGQPTPRRRLTKQERQVVQQRTLRQVYDWVLQYHNSDFPVLPNYQNFVRHCHRVLPLLNRLLSNLLASETALRFMDATMLPVCKMV